MLQELQFVVGELLKVHWHYTLMLSSRPVLDLNISKRPTGCAGAGGARWQFSRAAGDWHCTAPEEEGRQQPKQSRGCSCHCRNGAETMSGNGQLSIRKGIRVNSKDARVFDVLCFF